MSKLSDYLPQKEKTFVQGRIPTDIYLKVKSIMDSQGYSWPDVLTASLRNFLDEVSPKKKYDRKAD